MNERSDRAVAHAVEFLHARTIVDGRVLMRGRRLLTLDKDTILREVGGRAARLGERQHGRRLQTYQP